MRGWIALGTMVGATGLGATGLGTAGAAHAMGPPALRGPLASGFDLASVSVQAAFGGLPAAGADHGDPDSRWLPSPLAAPPGPPHDLARLRIRGKKVKFRMAF